MNLAVRYLGVLALAILLTTGTGCLDSLNPNTIGGDPVAPGDPPGDPNTGGPPADPDPDPDPDPEPDFPPPPPPPPSGTVVFEQDFEGSNPFRGWLGRNTDTNLRVIEQESNRYGRLVYRPHSDWRITFLPRYEGLMDLRAEFSMRIPAGYRYKRYPEGDPQAGEIIGGGKHIWMLQSNNHYEPAEGREGLTRDGQTRLDFAAAREFGEWACTAYRYRPGGERPGEFKQRFYRGEWFEPGRWHRVRVDLHVNPGPGDDSGQLDVWIDGEYKGRMTGEFNVIGPTGGMRVLGFGNVDNLEGEPWMDVDDIRIEAR